MWSSRSNQARFSCMPKLRSQIQVERGDGEKWEEEGEEVEEGIGKNPQRKPLLE